MAMPFAQIFDSMFDAADYLGMACNKMRTDSQRLSAYREYEALCWYEAFTRRGLPFDAIPIGSIGRVCVLIDSRRALKPPSNS